MTAVKFQNSNMLTVRRIVFSLMIIFAAVLQNSKGMIFKVCDVNAMILIPLIVCIASFEKSVASMLFGLFAGVLWDMYSFQTDGFFSLMLTSIGFFTAIIILFYMRNNVITAFILSFVSAFMCNTFYWLVFVLLKGYDFSFYIYLRYYLPSALYSSLYVFVFYYAVKWIYGKTSEKKKRINY